MVIFTFVGPNHTPCHIPCPRALNGVAGPQEECRFPQADQARGLRTLPHAAPNAGRHRARASALLVIVYLR